MGVRWRSIMWCPCSYQTNLVTLKFVTAAKQWSSPAMTYLRVLDFRIPSGFRHFGLFILERYLWRLVKRTTTQERAATPFAREGFTRELQSLDNLRVRQIIDSWHPGPSCSKKPYFSRYKMWDNLYIARSIAPWFNLWKEQYRFDYEVCGLAKIWPNV